MMGCDGGDPSAPSSSSSLRTPATITIAMDAERDQDLLAWCRGAGNDALLHTLSAGYLLHRATLARRDATRVREAVDDIAASRVDAALAAREAVHREQRQAWERESSRLRGEVSSLRARLEDGLATEAVRALEAQLCERDSELARLRGSNRAKGVVGEATVAGEVARVLDDWSVEVVGDRSAHAMDIHVASPCGTRWFAVETKLKARVQRSDVTKFEGDFDALRAGRQSFAGALFVALGTGNIPRKGAFRVEVGPGGRPKVWLACMDEAELCGSMPFALRVLLDVHSAAAAAAAAVSTSTDASRGSSEEEEEACDEKDDRYMREARDAHLADMASDMMRRVTDLRRCSAQALADTKRALDTATRRFEQADGDARHIETTLSGMLSTLLCHACTAHPLRDSQQTTTG